MNTTGDNDKKGVWPRPHYRLLFGIPLAGILIFAAGIIFWAGFNTVIEASSSTAFCTSCHEMDTAYEEYKQSVHYSNAVGIRAECADCHIPKHPWIAKMTRKATAGFTDVWHKMLGTIDTKDKYEAKRKELAEEVWASMKANDSHECRSCHTQAAMALDKQDKSASKKHTKERMLEKGETCIDCHKGVAHALPEGAES